MDFLSRQKKLQAEAKLALAMAKPMAKMQVEVEKQNRKKSPVADLVRVLSSVVCFTDDLQQSASESRTAVIVERLQISARLTLPNTSVHS